MRYSSAIFTTKNIKVGNTKLISGLLVFILKPLSIFGIKYYLVKSKTTSSIYVVVYAEKNPSKAVKIRFSNH